MGKARATRKIAKGFNDAIENLEKEMTNDPTNISNDDNNEDGEDDILITQLIAHSASKRPKVQKTPKEKKKKTKGLTRICEYVY